MDSIDPAPMPTEQAHTPELDKLAMALAKAQAQIKPPVFDAKNPHFRSQYLTLHGVIECARKPLADNGLSVVQMLNGHGESLTVRTMLLHSSGQWLSCSCPVIFGRGTGPQAAGSGITYAKRYSYASLLGICGSDEDDDGEAAQESYRAPAKKPSKKMVIRDAALRRIEDAKTLTDLQRVAEGLKGAVKEVDRTVVMEAYQAKSDELNKALVEEDDVPY